MTIKVDVLNQHLQVDLEPLVYAEFCGHKGLRKPNIPILCRDEVHLSDHGIYTLCRSSIGATLCWSCEHKLRWSLIY